MRTMALVLLACSMCLGASRHPAFSEVTVEAGVPIPELILLEQMEDLLKEQVSVISEEVQFFSQIIDWRTPFCRTKRDRIDNLQNRRAGLERDMRTASMRLESWGAFFRLREAYAQNDVRLRDMYDRSCKPDA